MHLTKAEEVPLKMLNFIGGKLYLNDIDNYSIGGTASEK